jgi:hypothetical protein
MSDFFSFDPMANASSMATFRELSALREMAERDRNALVIQGEILIKISDLLIVQQAFSGNTHEENFLRRFNAISAVSEITPARYTKVKSLQDDMLSLIQKGYIASCECIKCKKLWAEEFFPKNQIKLSKIRNQIDQKNEHIAIVAQEIAAYQEQTQELPKISRKVVMDPVGSIAGIATPGLLILLILLFTVLSPSSLARQTLINDLPIVGERYASPDELGTYKTKVNGTVDSVSENSDGTFLLVINTPSGIQVNTEYASPEQVQLEARKFTFLPVLVIVAWLTIVILFVLNFRNKVNKRSSFESGFDPVAAKKSQIEKIMGEIKTLEKHVISTANERYDAIDHLEESDQFEEFIKVARLGHAGALASHSWLCLYTGRHQEAVDLYVETRKTVSFAADSVKLKTELANCDNNQALNLLATGHDVLAARELWDSNKDVAESPECVFYSLAMKVRDGSATLTEIGNLPQNLLGEIYETLDDGLTANCWYKQWCGQVLSEFGSALPGTASQDV